MGSRTVQVVPSGIREQRTVAVTGLSMFALLTCTRWLSFRWYVRWSTFSPNRGFPDCSIT